MNMLPVVAASLPGAAGAPSAPTPGSVEAPGLLEESFLSLLQAALSGGLLPQPTALPTLPAPVETGPSSLASVAGKALPTPITVPVPLTSTPSPNLAVEPIAFAMPPQGAGEVVPADLPYDFMPLPQVAPEAEAIDLPVAQPQQSAPPALLPRLDATETSLSPAPFPLPKQVAPVFDRALPAPLAPVPPLPFEPFALADEATVTALTRPTPFEPGSGGEPSVEERAQPDIVSPSATLAAAGLPTAEAPRVEGPSSPVSTEGPPVRPVSDQLGDGIVAHARLIERGAETEFVLELHPPELGKVQVHLHSTQEGLTARLLVADEGARLLIESQLAQLRERLTESACPVVRCSVGDMGGQGQPRQQHQQPPWQQAPPPYFWRMLAGVGPTPSMEVELDRLDVVA